MQDSPLRTIKMDHTLQSVYDNVKMNTASSHLIERLMALPNDQLHETREIFGLITPDQTAPAPTCDWIRVDSHAFVSIDGLYSAVASTQNHANNRDACFTGDDPVAIPA